MTNEERFKAIFQDQVNRPGADDLLEWLENAGFFTAPASTKYHGAYPGGLVDHSLRVYDFLISSPYAVGTIAESRAICALLHDVCKVEYYEPKDDGGYRVNDQFPFGHGEKSVYQISRFMYLTDEEALAIRWHMGAYDDAARGGSQTLLAALSLLCLPCIPRICARRRKNSGGNGNEVRRMRKARRAGPPLPVLHPPG